MHQRALRPDTTPPPLRRLSPTFTILFHHIFYVKVPWERPIHCVLSDLKFRYITLKHNPSHLRSFLWTVRYLAFGENVDIWRCGTPSYLWTSCIDYSTHWGRDKIATISQTSFSRAFPWMTTFSILKKDSLKYVHLGPIYKMASLVQIMAWRRTGDGPLSEPILVCFIDAYMHHPASMN